MAKPEYNLTDLVRVQKVGGASIECHGKFAGDIIEKIKELAWVDISKAGTGHFVLQVSGGMHIPKDQTSLDLKADDQVVPQQLIADIAPSPKVMEEFKKLLTGMVIMDAGYDQMTGLYTLTINNGKVKKGKPVGGWQLSFVNCTATEILEKKKSVLFGRSVIVPGEKEDSLEACLYDALMQGTRQHDRWQYLADEGCSDSEIVTHVREVFGKTGKVKEATIRGISCLLDGKATPVFTYSPVDKDPITYVGAGLVTVVRTVMGVGLPKKTS